MKSCFANHRQVYLLHARGRGCVVGCVVHVKEELHFFLRGSGSGSVATPAAAAALVSAAEQRSSIQCGGMLHKAKMLSGVCRLGAARKERVISS